MGPAGARSRHGAAPAPARPVPPSPSAPPLWGEVCLCPLPSHIRVPPAWGSADAPFPHGRTPSAAFPQVEPPHRRGGSDSHPYPHTQTPARGWLPVPAHTPVHRSSFTPWSHSPDHRVHSCPHPCMHRLRNQCWVGPLVSPALPRAHTAAVGLPCGPACAPARSPERSCWPEGLGQEKGSRVSARPWQQTHPLRGGVWCEVVRGRGRPPPLMPGSCPTSRAAPFWVCVSFPLPAFLLNSIRGCCHTAFMPPLQCLSSWPAHRDFCLLGDLISCLFVKTKN